MYALPVILLKYLRYLATAANGNGHGIHSPFVYDFVRKVLKDEKIPDAFRDIESLRKRLKQDQRTIHIEDMGAGSVHGLNHNRRVGEIARTSAKPAKYARLLYRISNHYRCRSAIELGTSLGISTAYLAMVPGMEKLVTVEGSDPVLQVARENFDVLACNNIMALHGHFDQTLNQALDLIPSPDLVFFDGNHQYAPTLQYFEKCLPHAHAHSIFIFDDIHWSSGMEQAWTQICQHPRVHCTIDLFFLGIVFFRDAFKEKQHFTIRY